MDNFEKVEKLKERANVTYEEAKQALEESGWDILDAMIYLERQGKTTGSAQAGYESAKEESYTQSQDERGESFGDVISRFGRWCKKWIDKGNSNNFCVDKKGEEILRIPVTLLVVLLIFTFWVIVPLLIVGLFFDMRYRFRGPDVQKEDLNRAMDNVADAAEVLKGDIVDR